MERKLMKGNEIIGASAIMAGCRFFAGYPITPQNEVPEYMSSALPKVGGTFVQAESEVAAINMIYGAAAAGIRAMTSSSSPGIALKQEGITYIAAAELPCVIVNVMRGGPGLGGIQPSQADYFQCTRGGGNGDYNVICYAPANLQELSDLMQIAFETADYYRNPAMIVADGMLGQMMEAVELNPCKKQRSLPAKDWAVSGTKGKRPPNIINTVFLDPDVLEGINRNLQKKYAVIRQEEQLWDTYHLENADVICVAYGTTSRIVKSAIKILEEEGIRVGLVRPITLWPFPQKAFENLPSTAKSILVVEMSEGQMVEDVRLAVNGKLPVDFYGRSGGVIPSPDEIIDRIKGLKGE